MVLHTVCQSPYQHSALKQCLTFISAPATLLLIEEGVYAATNAAAPYLQPLPAGIDVYALEADLLARGLSTQINPRIKVIADRGFVELSVTCERMQAWY